jgi:hypothetical protein
MKKVILSFDIFKRYVGTGSVSLINFLTKQKIGKIEFTTEPWDDSDRFDDPELKKKFAGKQIVKWVIDLQKGKYIKFNNGKISHSEEMPVGELIQEIMDLISRNSTNKYSNVTVYRRNSPIKTEEIMKNSLKIKKIIREIYKKRRLNEATGLHPDVVRQYLETALWSSNDDSDESGGEPFDRNYDISDIAPESVAKSKKDIEKFIDMADEEGVLDSYLDAFTGPSWGNLGHDFWLTRNHHGAGFWDRNEIDDEVGKKLTNIAQKFKEVYPVLGDDGKIYFE